MMSRHLLILPILLVTSVVAGFPLDGDEPAIDAAIGNNARTAVAPQSVDEARRQAALLHQTYVATLLVVHREYFDKEERDTLPARAFEEVFKEIDARTKGHTRWISVNTPAMNVDHEPKPGFEAVAASALSNGSEAFESTADGFYHRAVGVPFSAHCSKCHQSALGHRRSGRMAGLVISLPLQKH